MSDTTEKSLCRQVLESCQFYLKDGDSANELGEQALHEQIRQSYCGVMRDTRMLLAGLDQSLFQRDLLRHLRKSFDYPQNLNAFVDDLKRYMQDAKRFAELQSNIFSAILIVFVLLQLSVVFVCDSLHH